MGFWPPRGAKNGPGRASGGVPGTPGTPPGGGPRTPRGGVPRALEGPGLACSYARAAGQGFCTPNKSLKQEGNWGFFGGFPVSKNNPRSQAS